MLVIFVKSLSMAHQDAVSLGKSEVEKYSVEIHSGLSGLGFESRHLSV